MERYILKYLYDSTQDVWRKRYYDYMKLDLDSTLWAYGANMAVGNLERAIEHQENYVIPRKNSIKTLFEILARAVDRKLFKNRKLQKQATTQSLSDSSVLTNGKYKVFCAFHLPWLLPDESILKLKECGIDVDFISDSSKSWSSSVAKLQIWHRKIHMLPFNEQIKEVHVQELKRIYSELVDAFRQTDYDAVFVYTTSTFEMKIFIDVFKEINKLSIELLHGIPAIDVLKVIDRLDYYLVYGDKLRQNCISAGCDAKKVAVVGDCKYVEELKVPKSLRCSLDDVLVLTTTTSEPYQFEWIYEDFSTSDRSLLITYLYSVEKVLKMNGVTHARLRPHPHVSREWIVKFIDMDFYELDDRWNMEQSLNQATCCISQNSTIVLEALMNGVSCLVYEPGNGKRSMTNAILYPPFDGSDKNMRVANTEEQLAQMLKERYCPSTEICSQYMENFKPEVIREILEKEREKK